MSAAKINSEWFIKFRERLRWSQQAMAEFLGVSDRTIRNWECGKQRIPKAYLMLLMTIDVSTPDLLKTLMRSDFGDETK
jgi:DNA-binding transcriptional regulator YiaG